MIQAIITFLICGTLFESLFAYYYAGSTGQSQNYNSNQVNSGNPNGNKPRYRQSKNNQFRENEPTFRYSSSQQGNPKNVAPRYLQRAKGDVQVPLYNQMPTMATTKTTAQIKAFDNYASEPAFVDDKVFFAI